jgi:hypothetical protein
MRATADGKVKITLDFIRDIIIHELELQEDQVVIYNQKWMIPNDDRLYITVEYNGTPKTIASRNSFNSETQEEEQVINTQENIVLGILSRGIIALQRKEEVIMALGSIYSQQTQEANSFQIGYVAPIQNLTKLEASALLYRFDIPFNVLAWYEKSKTVDFYDSYTGRVKTEEVTVDFTQPVVDPDPTA